MTTLSHVMRPVAPSLFKQSSNLALVLLVDIFSLKHLHTLDNFPFLSTSLLKAARAQRLVAFASSQDGRQHGSRQAPYDG